MPDCASLGVDFGTTNSALALATQGGVQLAQFRLFGRDVDTFRSVLYFDPDVRTAMAGPAAIEEYLAQDGSGRFIQSIKSYLPSRLFKSTNVGGRVYPLEDLIAIILRALRTQSEQQLGALPERVAVGRPVRFAGSEHADDEAHALARLRAALDRAGFGEVVFEYEPVAAAYKYESELTRDELALIADFGGGTSDFCVVRVGPSVRARGRQPGDILGTEGVGIAGDAFDGRIVRHLVAPQLGRGSEYVSLHGKDMTVPPWLYSHLQRWHELSFLKSQKTLALLETIQRGAKAPAQIEALKHLIENDLGFALYRAVERLKVELSIAEEAVLEFTDGPLALSARVKRREFESWIADQLDAFAACVDRLLAKTGVWASDIDAVFMTGGSSLVPAVRAVFERRFGASRIHSGGELTSVAVGLALRALG
jgi:hypothetical chaperone protein